MKKTINRQASAPASRGTEPKRSTAKKDRNILQFDAAVLKPTKAADRRLAERYRQELYAEYSTGTMAPERKAMALEILGANFFDPVDKFEAQCREVEAYLARKAPEKVAREGLKG
jgi:hypothetical protein